MHILVLVLLLASPTAATETARTAALEQRIFASCGDDLDADGLSDAAEAELAQTFRPYYLFDEEERHRLHGEPATLFQVRPVGCVGKRSLCDRAGDNQYVRLEVVSEDDGRTFWLSRIENGLFEWPGASGVRFLEGTHPWIYFSLGKHHQFFDRSLDAKDSPYSRFGCNDDVDGKGERFLAELRGSDGRWNNVGEPEWHPEPAFVGDLEALGFADEHAHDEEPFCGGIECTGGTAANATRWSRAAYLVPETESVPASIEESGLP